jgi:hypothetical protein
MAVVSGGTTLIDNGALDAGVATGSLILLSTQTASSSASISFTSGIDNTYDSYVFKFIDIHPSVDQARLEFQGSTDGGSNYGLTITSTAFWARHSESDATASLSGNADHDIAQGTTYQSITHAIGNGGDESAGGYLQIYNPSNTTYVKHFIASSSTYLYIDYEYNTYHAGYFNITSAINAFQFRMTSGNIDDGIIKMYGVV